MSFGIKDQLDNNLVCVTVRNFNGHIREIIQEQFCKFIFNHSKHPTIMSFIRLDCMILIQTNRLATVI